MGRWIEIRRAWHDTALTTCALCGRLVPRRIWQVEIDGERLPFCNQECEALYRSYWLPKYGARDRSRGEAESANAERSVTSTQGIEP